MSGAMPYFGDAYMADTRHLTLEEHGAYHLLLLIAWRTPDCALPNDDKRIAQMLGITPKKWAALKPTVMAFWTLTDHGWEQKRQAKERRWVDENRAKQSERAQSRWGAKVDDGKPARAVDPDHRRKRSQRLADARAKGKHTVEQWEALLDATGDKCVKCGDGAGQIVKDHIQPLYQGGSDAISNIQPLCIRCNASKGPDRTDFRLSACKDLFERLPECLPQSAETPAGMPAPPPPPPPPPIDSSGSKEPSPRELWSRPPVSISRQTWSDFKQNRKSKRLGFTVSTYRNLEKDLQRVSIETGIPPPELLEHAAAHGWGGIYDPNERKKGHERDSNPTAIAVQRITGAFGACD